jgi:probable phosphoglycerate mutase
MATIRIARHGETTWNAVGRYQGHIDAPLSPLGQAQAQALAQALQHAGIRRIVSSPLSRCVNTALPLSTATNVPIETDPLLIEIAHGSWQGRYREEIARSEPELYARWREHPETVHFPGGESLADVLNRWKKFVAAFDASADTLIVTHDIVVRIALLERTNRELKELRTMRASNCGYAQFEVRDDRWRLEDACVVTHLAELTADPERQAL